MLDGKDLVEGEWPPCSFYMHATCVSMTKQMVDNIQTLCKPGCVEYSIHQESIHVSKYETSFISAFIKYSKLGKKSEEFLKETQGDVHRLDLIEMTLHMAEVPGIKYEEKVDYSFAELISETGGSMGIFLGLSLVDIFALFRLVTQNQWTRRIVSSI